MAFRPTSPARPRRPAPPLPTPQHVEQLRTSVSRSLQAVPQQRLQAARQEFEQFDRDKSGSISKGEAKEYLLDELGLELEPGYIDELWGIFDADNNGTLDKDEWVLLREHLKAEGDAEGATAYSVHGSARLPGSKYSISEIEINESETRRQLEALVEDTRLQGHSGGGCCGLCCKSESVLDAWKFNDNATAIQQEIRMSLEQFLGPEPAAAHSAEDHAKGEEFGYNPNFFCPNDEKLTLLNYNRRALIELLLEDDEKSLPFKAEDESAAAHVHTKKHPTDEEIQAWDERKLRSELKRRNFLVPPYKVHDSTGAQHVIGKDAAGGKGTEKRGERSSEHTHTHTHTQCKCTNPGAQERQRALA
eukprot:SAG22_NODE_1331_length_4702_cov_2.662177_1_plen_361_part_00